MQIPELLAGTTSPKLGGQEKSAQTQTVMQTFFALATIICRLCGLGTYAMGETLHCLQPPLKTLLPSS